MFYQKKNKKKLSFGPVITILILTIGVMILSLVLSHLQFQGDKTVIENGRLTSQLTIVNNIFTLEGMQFLYGNIVNSFQSFEPLVLLIIALIGISIGESSGLFDVLFGKVKKLSNTGLIFLTVLIGVASSIIGDYNYIILIPLVGVIYKLNNKNPILGIITIFVGMTIGYGTGFFYNDLDYVLGGQAQISATLEVDRSYSYSLLSSFYIMITSAVVISIIMTILINKFVVPRLPKKNNEVVDERKISKKALYCSNIAFLILLALVVYMIIPGLPNSGLLLDNNSSEYIDKLFGSSSPFRNGFIYIISVCLMICGFVYGRISGNIKNTAEYSLGLSKSFHNVGFVFVLMFFTSQMISILDWTNIGPVIVSNLLNITANLPFSGLPLIITFFIFVIIMSILMPSTTAKWTLASPLIIPLFMRANITPDFTLFIYRVADGMGKCFSPMFVYFIIMLAFLEKYNTDENYKVTVFGNLKALMPIYLIMAGVWLLIIICWYIIGLPIGVGTYPTL